LSNGRDAIETSSLEHRMEAGVLPRERVGGEARSKDIAQGRKEEGSLFQHKTSELPCEIIRNS
jgi:hypothetical protein